MSKAEMHAPFTNFRGKIGKLIYKKVKGKTIVSHEPDPDRQLTPGVIRQRKHFTDSASYATAALADPAKLEFYETIAQQKKLTPRAVAVADFLTEPTIGDLDLSKYRGNVGETISIMVVDKIGVEHVNFSLVAVDGTPIESGEAVEVIAGSWVYTATVQVAPGSDIFIEAEAFDRPGHRVVSSANPIVQS